MARGALRKPAILIQQFGDDTCPVGRTHFEHDQAQECFHRIGADIHPHGELFARKTHREADQRLLLAIREMIIEAKLVHCIGH